MNYRIENGKNLVKIRTNGGVSYLLMEKPISIIWADCQGSIGQLFTLTKYSSEKRISIIEELNLKVYKNYENELEITDDFLELLQLFESGDYSIEFFNKYQTEQDSQLMLLFNKKLVMTNKLLFEETKIQISNLANDRALDYISTEFQLDYSYKSNDTLMFTRPFESIDLDRVAFFENEIKQGKKPFAIILSKEYDLAKGNTRHFWCSGNFILDGHHKLLAYNNLKIEPPILKITHLLNEVDGEKVNIKDLEEVLLPNHIARIKYYSLCDYD